MVNFKHYPGAWAGVIFATGVAIFLDVLVAFGVRNGLRSESFATTPGVITRSEIEPGHKGAIDHEVEYQYTINGILYTNTEYHVQPQFLGNSYWRNACDAHPTGKAVVVYYDPNNPAASYLVPGLRSDILFVGWWATAVTLLAFGLWVCAFESLSGKRGFDPARWRCVRTTRNGWAARPDPTSRLTVTSYTMLLATFAVGCFVTGGYAVMFTNPPPWFIPVAMYLAAPVIAIRFGTYFSREGRILVNDRDRTVEFAHKFGRVTLAWADVLGIDITTEERKVEAGTYEVFCVTLRWRDQFEQLQSTRLAEYTADVDAAALLIWLRERLGVPVAT